MAVGSRTLAAAAAAGLRTPPARATGTAWRVVFWRVWRVCSGTVRGWIRAEDNVSFSKMGDAEVRAAEVRRRTVRGAIMIVLEDR